MQVRQDIGVCDSNRGVSNSEGTSACVLTCSEGLLWFRLTSVRKHLNVHEQLDLHDAGVFQFFA